MTIPARLLGAHEAGANGRGVTDLIDLILDGDGNPIKGPEALSLLESRARLSRLLSKVLSVLGDEDSHRRALILAALDRFEQPLRDLRRRHLAAFIGLVKITRSLKAVALEGAPAVLIFFALSVIPGLKADMNVGHRGLHKMPFGGRELSKLGQANLGEHDPLD